MLKSRTVLLCIERQGTLEAWIIMSNSGLCRIIHKGNKKDFSDEFSPFWNMEPWSSDWLANHAYQRSLLYSKTKFDRISGIMLWDVGFHRYEDLCQWSAGKQFHKYSRLKNTTGDLRSVLNWTRFLIRLQEFRLRRHIDEVAIYNRALTAQEIQNHYTSKTIDTAEIRNKQRSIDRSS